jgi:hypothetical protein
MRPNSRHDGNTISAYETRSIQSDAQFARFQRWRKHAIIDDA